jgi:hypothetical protein
VPELGSLGSVRGALSNERPYREHHRNRPSKTVGHRWRSRSLRGKRGEARDACGGQSTFCRRAGQMRKGLGWDEW